eukprot:1352336-Amorphochlora_amoeboformis.AAC.1
MSFNEGGREGSQIPRVGENKDKRLARPTVWIYCGKDFTPLDFYHGHSRMIMDCCVTHDETTIATASKVFNIPRYYYVTLPR